MSVDEKKMTQVINLHNTVIKKAMKIPQTQFGFCNLKAGK